jgi:hypothetical protein
LCGGSLTFRRSARTPPGGHRQPEALARRPYPLRYRIPYPVPYPRPSAWCARRPPWSVLVLPAARRRRVRSVWLGRPERCRPRGKCGSPKNAGMLLRWRRHTCHGPRQESVAVCVAVLWVPIGAAKLLIYKGVAPVAGVAVRSQKHYRLKLIQMLSLWHCHNCHKREHHCHRLPTFSPQHYHRLPRPRFVRLTSGSRATLHSLAARCGRRRGR